MPLKPETWYDATVARGSSIITSGTGKLGFQVALTCEDGAAMFIIWLTEANRERAIEMFTDALGVPAEKLTDGGYVADRLSSEIEGREVSIFTKEETYDNRTRVKVAILRRRGQKPKPGSPASFAGFFGGVKPPAAPREPNAHGVVVEDSDLPF